MNSFAAVGLASIGKNHPFFALALAAMQAVPDHGANKAKDVPLSQPSSR
jgi:ABC-type uncharacterized transport system permease subunit